MSNRGAASCSSAANNAPLESRKGSSDILREARAAIRLADSTEDPYSSLAINDAAGLSSTRRCAENRKIIKRSRSVISDYSERNSIPDKTRNKKSPSSPASGHSFSRLSSLRPTVVPAPLFQRQPQQPYKRKSFDKSNGATNSPSNSPAPFGNYGYAPSAAEAYARQSAFPKEETSTERNGAEKDNPREELTSFLASVRTDTEAGNNVSLLGDAVLERAEMLRHGPLRSELMKEMFRLMNQSEPDTTVKIVDIILRLKPSGKNLTTIFKVLYRLSEDDNNDQILAENDFLTRFVTILRELPSWKYLRALLYGFGMLKNLSLNQNALGTMGEMGHLIAAAISQHLSALTRRMRKKMDKQEAAYASFLYILDVSEALSGGVPEVRVKVFANEANLASELCGSLAARLHDLDVALKIVQILRSVARNEEGCEYLARCPFCFPLCVQILEKYFGHQILVAGVCYLLGGVVATRKESGSLLYETPRALDVLLALLRHYVNNERNYKKGGKANWSEESENNSGVIYEVLRVLANTSCSDEVGLALAKHTLCVDLLLDILDPKIASLEKRVFLATLTTLSNVAYYLGSGNSGASAALLAEKLLPLLANSDDPEVAVEIYRNLSNLTRDERVRILLIKRKLIAELLDHLEEEYLALVYYGAAILLNLSVEREARLQFHANGGISRAMGALRDLVPDEWPIGSLLCRLIWNFARGQIGQSVNVTGEEARVLIRALEQLIDENYVFPDKDPRDEDEKEVRRNWERAFCPLAIELLDFLTAGVARL